MTEQHTEYVSPFANTPESRARMIAEKLAAGEDVAMWATADIEADSSPEEQAKAATLARESLEAEANRCGATVPRVTVTVHAMRWDRCDPERPVLLPAAEGAPADVLRFVAEGNATALPAAGR